MDELIQAALDEATANGASYADVRAVETMAEALSVRGATVEALDRSESVGFGVRVLRNGAWGFAASARLDKDAAAKVARTAAEVDRNASALGVRRPVELVPEPVHVASWSSPVKKGSVHGLTGGQGGAPRVRTEPMEKVPGSESAAALWTSRAGNAIWFVSSEGSAIDQNDRPTRGGDRGDGCVGR